MSVSKQIVRCKKHKNHTTNLRYGQCLLVTLSAGWRLLHALLRELPVDQQQADPQLPER